MNNVRYPSRHLHIFQKAIITVKFNQPINLSDDNDDDDVVVQSLGDIGLQSSLFFALLSQYSLT